MSQPLREESLSVRQSRDGREIVVTGTRHALALLYSLLGALVEDPDRGPRPRGKDRPVMILRTLSVLQPWASLLILGQKQYETRTWATDFRGLLAIHASARFTEEQRALAREEPFCAALAGSGTLHCLDSVGCIARREGESRQWAEAALRATGEPVGELPASMRSGAVGPYGERTGR